MRKIIDVRVGDLMSAPALTVTPETTIDELTRLFAEHEFNGLPVVNDLRILQGIVTQLDLFKLHLLPYHGSSPPSKMPGPPRSAPS
jgi:CBS-domain-containing membrane protein